MKWNGKKPVGSLTSSLGSVGHSSVVHKMDSCFVQTTSVGMVHKTGEDGANTM